MSELPARLLREQIQGCGLALVIAPIRKPFSTILRGVIRSCGDLNHSPLLGRGKLTCRKGSRSEKIADNSLRIGNRNWAKRIHPHSRATLVNLAFVDEFHTVFGRSDAYQTRDKIDQAAVSRLPLRSRKRWLVEERRGNKTAGPFRSPAVRLLVVS